MRELKYIAGIIFLSMFFSMRLISQDIHFSQFWLSPINLNSANTGNFDGDYRVVLNNKNQWQSFTNAYKTVAGSFDAAIENKFFKKSILGLGLQINNDIAGDGRLATTQIMISSGFNTFIDAQQKFKVGLGFSSSYINHSLDINQFRFGSQFDIDQYNPDLSSNEIWQFEKSHYFDINSGISFTYFADTSFNLSFGASAAHINQPKRSFYENSEMHLPVKWSYFIDGEYNIKQDLWLEPKVLYMHQLTYSEFLMGAMLRFDYNPLSFKSLFIGALFRNKDSGIIAFGADYKDVKFTISYDVNLSGLSTISRGKGGAEFSLIYIIAKPKPFKSPYYRKCPEFI